MGPILPNDIYEAGGECCFIVWGCSPVDGTGLVHLDFVLCIPVHGTAG